MNSIKRQILSQLSLNWRNNHWICPRWPVLTVLRQFHNSSPIILTTHLPRTMMPFSMICQLIIGTKTIVNSCHVYCQLKRSVNEITTAWLFLITINLTAFNWILSLNATKHCFIVVILCWLIQSRTCAIWRRQWQIEWSTIRIQSYGNESVQWALRVTKFHP